VRGESGSAVSILAPLEAAKKGVVHTASMNLCGGMMWYPRMASRVAGGVDSRFATSAHSPAYALDHI